MPVSFLAILRFKILAGEDLYTFEDAVKPNTGSFYVRQIVGSTNYPTGTDPVDFAHGFLNYQVSCSEVQQHKSFRSVLNIVFLSPHLNRAIFIYSSTCYSLRRSNITFGLTCPCCSINRAHQS
jgi:hypothetical protein